MEVSKQKTAVYAGALLIVLLLIGLVFSSVSNSKGRKNLISEKLVSEKLLSEKLSFEKELERLKTDYSSLKQKIDFNAKLIDETNTKILENDKRIKSLSNENRSLRASKKELEELKKTKADLEKEATLLKSEYEKSLSQNKDLKNSLASLENEKSNLALKLENAQKFNSNNFLVTATRGKNAEKLVIKATRARKLNMIFEVPQSLTEALTFTLVTPSGTTIDQNDKSLTWYFPLDSRNFTASLSALTGMFEQSRQVVLNYVPKSKLEKGEYKIQILCDGNKIGNCRIMLK